jgi:hypothetical protein
MNKLPAYKSLSVVRSEPEAEVGSRAGEGAETAEPQLLTDLAHHFMVYIHHEAYKALCRYALEETGPRSKVKPHDLMIEALEDWFAKNGLNKCAGQGKTAGPPAAAQSCRATAQSWTFARFGGNRRVRRRMLTPRSLMPYAMGCRHNSGSRQ